MRFGLYNAGGPQDVPERGGITRGGHALEGNGLVASLFLAHKERRDFKYVGKVGTGWSMAQSAKLRAAARGDRGRRLRSGDLPIELEGLTGWKAIAYGEPIVS